jgi:hypothetical protein
MPENGENANHELIGFIVKALREHEQEIDLLINRLDDAKNKQTNLNQRLYGKATHIEEKLHQLKENLDKIKALTNPPSASDTQCFAPAASISTPENHNHQNSGARVVVRCVRWEDFQSLSAQADWVTFMLDGGEKAFQVEALKAGQLMTYRGNTPVEVGLLKAWLIRQLEIANERTVLSGSISMNRLN